MSVVFDRLANNALQRSNAWTKMTNALAAERKSSADEYRGCGKTRCRLTR